MAPTFYELARSSSQVHPDVSLAECGARCWARPHCLGYNYQRAARNCALLTQPARFVPEPGHVAARKCTSCQLREWTKVI